MRRVLISRRAVTVISEFFRLRKLSNNLGRILTGLLHTLGLSEATAQTTSRNFSSETGLFVNGSVAPWPEGFGDRLFVIKFNFTKNSTTGKTIIGDNNSFN